MQFHHLLASPSGTSESIATSQASRPESVIRPSWHLRAGIQARRCRTIQIQAGQHAITAADPLPDDLRHALEAINQAKVCTNFA